MEKKHGQGSLFWTMKTHWHKIGMPMPMTRECECAIILSSQSGRGDKGTVLRALLSSSKRCLLSFQDHEKEVNEHG